MHWHSRGRAVARWVRRHGDICLDEYDQSLKDLDVDYLKSLDSCWPGCAYSDDVIYAASRKIDEILALQRRIEFELHELDKLDSARICFPDDILDEPVDRLELLQRLCCLDLPLFESFGMSIKASAKLVSEYYLKFNQILASDLRPCNFEDYDPTAFLSREYALCRALRDNVKFDIKLYLEFSVPDSSLSFRYNIREIDDAIFAAYALNPDYVIHLDKDKAYDFSSLDSLVFPDMPELKSHEPRGNPEWKLRAKALRAVNKRPCDGPLEYKTFSVERYKLLDYVRLDAGSTFDGIDYLWHYARENGADISAVVSKISNNRRVYHMYVRKFRNACFENPVLHVSQSEQDWMAAYHAKIYRKFDLDMYYIVRWRIGSREFAQACSLERMCMMAGLHVKLPSIESDNAGMIPVFDTCVIKSGPPSLNPRFEVKNTAVN